MIPQGVEDIGAWQFIFTSIAKIAVVTNAGIAIFTMPTFDAYGFGYKVWLFVWFQYICFAFQGMVMVMVPDMPESRLIQLKRAEFINSKLIDKLPDDELKLTAEKNFTDKDAESNKIQLSGFEELPEKVRAKFGSLSVGVH